MDAKSGRILLSWVAVVAYCIIIWIMSSMRSPLSIPSFDYSDKILHMGAFVVLAILFWRALGTLSLKMNLPGIIFLTFFASTVFGALIEVNQLFLSHRKAEVMDLGADILGCGLGILICLAFFRKRYA